MTRKAVATIKRADGAALHWEFCDERGIPGGGAFAVVDADPAAETFLLYFTLADDEAIERLHSGHWGLDPQSGALVELPFKAMLLGVDDVLEGVVDLAGAHELTERHVDLRPHGGDCDAEPGRYRWDRELEQLVPLKRSEIPSAPGGVSLEDAFAQLLEKNPSLKQGDRTMVWLAGYRGSFDAMRRKQ